MDAGMTPPTNPPVREDGKCVVDGKDRPPLAVQASDPFCGTLCCRKYHGIVFKSDATSRPNAKKRVRHDLHGGVQQ
jgi:hypothetical protein